MGEQIELEKPFPANVPGDFFVIDGCCTMCEAPFGEAPELFGTHHDKEGWIHCFVKKQPETDEELKHMLSACEVAELNCIKYRGNDPELVRHFKAIDDEFQAFLKQKWWQFWKR